MNAIQQATKAADITVADVAKNASIAAERAVENATGIFQKMFLGTITNWQILATSLMSAQLISERLTALSEQKHFQWPNLIWIWIIMWFLMCLIELIRKIPPTKERLTQKFWKKSLQITKYLRLDVASYGQKRYYWQSVNIWNFAKTPLLGQNLKSTNSRKPIKGSKDADFCLVCLKKTNRWIVTWTSFSGLDSVVRPPVASPHQKKFKPQVLEFLKIELRRLSASLKGLNSSPALSVSKLWLYKVNATAVVLLSLTQRKSRSIFFGVEVLGYKHKNVGVGFAFFNGDLTEPQSWFVFVNGDWTTSFVVNYLD